MSRCPLCDRVVTYSVRNSGYWLLFHKPSVDAHPDHCLIKEKHHAKTHAHARSDVRRVRGSSACKKADLRGRQNDFGLPHVLAALEGQGARRLSGQEVANKIFSRGRKGLRNDPRSPK